LKTENSENKINVAIVGAGSVGTLLAEELVANSRSRYKPYCFIDHDENKVGNLVNGLKVYSDNEGIIEKIKSMPVHEIIFALPKLSSEEAKKMHEFYSKTGCKVRIYDQPVTVDGVDYGAKKTLRDIRIEDLLFRDSLNVTSGKTAEFYKDKVVMVTGGGGSIGSELCRQIAKCSPKKLIIVDIYENNAYEIQQELLRRYKDSLDLCVEIASVRDVVRLECIFANYRPNIVFHAAAHKHVPLMEHSGCEAIKNNVAGTYNTANMAEKYGVEKFILISTDKAVNPTNIMGASKRMCEMIIQCRNDSKTSFAAVRFGNVLGSNGSVIPLFKRQIESGGPVTITDKRIIRYFMTIPEASQLVMQAGALAKSGELFVLDMGKPVKIIDLAENMIRLSGYIPYEDIDIVEMGLRPGEKLYEELLIKSEELDKTENKLIFIERDKPLSREEVDDKVAMLMSAVVEAKDELGAEIIKRAMKTAVSTYHDPEEVNLNAQNTEEMKMTVK
jgi:FlaA1/EpsC-like NDP-sugar epimerase